MIFVAFWNSASFASRAASSLITLASSLTRPPIFTYGVGAGVLVGFGVGVGFFVVSSVVGTVAKVVVVSSVAIEGASASVVSAVVSSVVVAAVVGAGVETMTALVTGFFLQPARTETAMAAASITETIFILFIVASNKLKLT